MGDTVMECFSISLYRQVVIIHSDIFQQFWLNEKMIRLPTTVDSLHTFNWRERDMHLSEIFILFLWKLVIDCISLTVIIFIIANRLVNLQVFSIPDQ